MADGSICGGDDEESLDEADPRAVDWGKVSVVNDRETERAERAEQAEMDVVVMVVRAARWQARQRAFVVMFGVWRRENASDDRGNGVERNLIALEVKCQIYEAAWGLFDALCGRF